MPCTVTAVTDEAAAAAGATVGAQFTPELSSKLQARARTRLGKRRIPHLGAVWKVLRELALGI